MKKKKKQILVNISQDLADFAINISKSENKSTSKLFEELLIVYKNHKITREIQEGFLQQEKENRELAEQGMDDFFSILNDYENN